jgi:hypothetical protein
MDPMALDATSTWDWQAFFGDATLAGDITMLGVKNGSCGQPDAKKYPNPKRYPRITTNWGALTFFIFCVPLQKQFHSQGISRDIVFGRPMLLGIRNHRYGTRLWQLGSQGRNGSTNGSKTLI